MTQRQNTERTSFASGEIGKTLHAASDLRRYETGVEKLENLVVLVEGIVTRRPGTRFVLELKDQAQKGRLIPFRFDGGDYYMLVFNGGKMRAVKAGGFLTTAPNTPYELTVPWVEADLPNLRSANSGNIVLMAAGAGKRPQKLTRTAPTNWSIADYQPINGPVDTPNLDTAVTIQAGGPLGNVNLTGGNNPFTGAEAGGVWRLDEPDKSLVPQWTANETVAAGVQRRYNGNVYSAVNAATTGGNPPTHIEGDVSSGSGLVTWRYLHSGYGFVRILGVTNGNVATGTVLSRLPDTCVSQPTYRWYPPAWSVAKGFPTTVVTHQQRALWARSADLFLTETGTFDSFEVHTGDDSAIIERLTSTNGALVKLEWAIAAGVVVLGTRDGEWILRAPGNYDAITLSTQRTYPETEEGSAPHVPAKIDRGGIFIGKSKRRLHFVQFDRLAEQIAIDEISVFAKHIAARGFESLAWQRDPHRICWTRLTDGTLAGITFMPAQQVTAWHRHPMQNAVIEDIAAIPASDDGVSEVYMIVRRTINGQTKRYVEVFRDFFSPANLDAPDATGAWFLDCALEYAGVATSTITGLSHLEGQTVGVFADGAMQGRKVVAGGDIALDTPAANVVVGLPIAWKIRDLPRNFKTQTGSTKGKKKKATHVVVDVLETASGKISINGGLAEPLVETGAANYGGPVKLKSGSIAMGPLEAGTENEVVVEISGDDALPFTLLGFTPDYRLEEP